MSYVVVILINKVYIVSYKVTITRKKAKTLRNSYVKVPSQKCKYVAFERNSRICET